METDEFPIIPVPGVAAHPLLAERGGFYPEEMDKFVSDWRAMCDEIGSLRERGAEDTARMDWLEGELERERGYQPPGYTSLFRRNVPIPRAAIDKARKDGSPI